MPPSLRPTLSRLVLGMGIVAGLALIFLVHPKTNAPPERKVITIWRVTGAKEVESPVTRWFNESQGEAFLQPVGLPFLEIEQKFLTAAVGNIPPDLFEYFGPVAQWSTRGALMPLDDFMERDGYDRSQIFPALWDEMMWNGRTYAIPTGTANEAFFWNKEDFRRAGLDPDRPPRTWKELDEYAVRLTTYAPDGSIDHAGYIPGYWASFQAPIFLNWPVQKGATFVNEDETRVDITQPANIEALAWEGRLFQKLGRDQLIAKRSSFGYGSQHGFMSGQLSMIVQKSSFVQEIQDFAPGLDYGVAPLPIPEDGSPGVIAGSVWIGIPAGAANPEEAWEFIKFYTSTDMQVKNAEFTAQQNLAAFFPANIEAANSPIQQAQPHMEVFVDSMNFARSSVVVPLAHSVFWREYQNAWDRVMRGVQEPEAALAQAETEVQRALDAQLDYNQFYSKWLAENEPVYTGE